MKNQHGDKMCFQCKNNQNKPHICVEAQVYGESAKCCDNEGCFSFREVARQVALQLGDNPPELHLQAILNSENVRLD